MPEDRRAYVPGGTFFLTIVAHDRQPILGSRENVARLRGAIRHVMRERPFRMPAAVVLPDHVHFLWSLPGGDTDFSRRVGRMKVLFTRSVKAEGGQPPPVSDSRRKHRESDVWQRRFWEHAVRDEADFERLLDDIHYNPVKHGLAGCPHQWPYSSFEKWVEAGLYTLDWGCSCRGRRPVLPSTVNDQRLAGE